MRTLRIAAIAGVALCASTCSKGSIAVCGPGIEIADAMPGASGIARVEAGNVHLDNGAAFELPESAAALSIADLRALFPHGAEVASDGIAYGLIDIWHTCGNDPIRRHTERVRVDSLVRFIESWRSMACVTGDDPGPFVTARGVPVEIFEVFASSTGTPWDYAGNWPMWNPPG